MSNSEFGLTAQGFCKKRLDDLITQLENEFKSVYGANFKVSPETKQGQIIANIAAEYASLWDIAEDSFNSFNPSAALDKALSDLVQYNGLTRQAATRSIVQLTLTGANGTIVPAGSQVEIVNSEIKFETTESVTITEGPVFVPAQALVTGPIVAAAGTLTTIFTPITGWATVTNAADATPGLNEETDEELRARRNRSTALGGRNIVDAIAAQIEALDNVLSVLVLENDTDVDPDANGVPAHSVEAIVRGGAAEDIRDVLLQNKVPGIPYAGNTNVPATDSQGVPVSINYTVPVEVPIQVEVNLTTNAEYPGNGDTLIAENIVAYAEGLLVLGRGFGVGEDVILSEIYTPVNFVPGHSVDSIRISAVGQPLGAANVTIDVRELATFDLADITVNS